MATNANLVRSRETKTIGLSSESKAQDFQEPLEIFLVPPFLQNVPRRRSYPLERENNSSSGCSADSEDENASSDNEAIKELKKSPLKKTISLDHYSPRSQRLHGIPLGTLTAQEAAKSFWNMDMLKQRLEKMAQYATEEGTTPSFSSMESVEVRSQDSGTVQETSPVKLTLPSQLALESHSAPNSPKERTAPRIKSPLMPQIPARPKTPPYMSPGMTRRLFKPKQQSSLTTTRGRKTTPAEQRWLIRVRNDLGDYYISDDGFHE